MAQIITTSGIRVDHPDELSVVALGDVPAGLARGAPSTRAPGGDDWVGPLKDAGFEIVDNLAFEPAAGIGLRAAPGFAATSPTLLDVPVSPDTGAVVLVEVEGLYHWTTPSEDVAPSMLRAPGRGGAAKRFILGPPSVPAGTAPAGPVPPGVFQTRGPVFDWIVSSKPFRAIVLRYALGPAARKLSEWLDGDGPFGLCDMSVDDAALWRPVPGAAIAVPANAKRVLLFVHGTFSSTRGSFGDLLTHAGGRAFLAGARTTYDLVLGFEHKTLSQSPQQNAEDLADALIQLALPPGTLVDAVAFSRGGLVLRSFVERTAIARAGGLPLKVGRLIFVACTNNGTHLAASVNWGALVDHYTTLCLSVAKATAMVPGVGQVTRFAATAVPVIGRFVQLFTVTGVHEGQIPGLSAMEPGSELITALNGAAGRPAKPGYRAITSNFVPGPLGQTHSGLALKALGQMAAGLFKADNDLVVDTLSMTTLWTGAEFEAIDSFGATHDVYHTCYFANERVADRLGEWLDTAPAVTRNPPSAQPPAIGGIETAAPVDTSAFGPLRGLADAATDAMETRAGVDEATAGHGSTVEGAQTSYDVAATMPPQVSCGAVAPLTLVVSRGQIEFIAADTTAGRRVALLASEPLQLRVTALDNCALVENGADVSGTVRTLALPAAGATRLEQFTVRGGAAAGPARLVITGLQAGRPVCEIELKPQVIAESNALLSATAVAFVGTGPSRASLVLRIFQTSDKDGWRLRFIADCPEENIALDEESNLVIVDPKTYAQQRFAEIERIVSSSKGFVNATRRLRDHGAEMGDFMMPDAVRETIWAKRAQLAAIQVISDETPIPWELACVRGPGDEEPVFLAELGLVRWIKNAGWPAERLRLDARKVCLLAPSYDKAGWELPGAQEEIAELRKVFPAAIAVTPTFDDVRDFLAGSNSIDALHVACHGAAVKDDANEVAALFLSDSPDDMFGNGSVRQSLRVAADCNPIVFLNACQVGKPGAGIGGIDGFAQSFIAPRSRAGAAVVVAPLWSAGDLKARAFALAFYQELAKGVTLVEAVRAARGQAKAQSELTWLSYSIYGDPFARVAVAPGAE